MINFAAERIRKYAQVADTQYFKKKAKCSEIGKQILRSALKRGCCNRGVDIVPCIRGTNRCFRLHVRIPCRHIFHDKDLAKHVQV